MKLYPGGHPSSYNPVRPGLTWDSVMKGNTLTASTLPKVDNFIISPARNKLLPCSTVKVDDNKLVYRSLMK